MCYVIGSLSEVPMPKILLSIRATSLYGVRKLVVSYSPDAFFRNDFPVIIITVAVIVGTVFYRKKLRRMDGVLIDLGQFWKYI